MELVGKDATELMHDLEHLQQLDALLALGNQSWLFGAGISVDAGIPLMIPLTTRVLSLIEQSDSLDEGRKILDAVREELPADTHIEHILSHLVDYVSIAHRADGGQVVIGEAAYDLELIEQVHDAVLRSIADTIRWGYVPSTQDAPERIGTRNESIVSIEHHRRFVTALFNKRQAGLTERRGPVRLFTTNYDTLVEDALALEGIPSWDGFSGGAVAFRSHRYGEPEPRSRYRAHLIKLHGSIDWYSTENDQVWRVRADDPYPDRNARVLIYPQSTKYVATQRDPFAAQFELFRRTLLSPEENVLIACGYSFGDGHINEEIEFAMRATANRTTLIVCVPQLNDLLVNWLGQSWSKRLYVMTKHGLHVGGPTALCSPPPGEERDWWTFAGLTNVLINGADAHVE